MVTVFDHSRAISSVWLEALAKKEGFCNFKLKLYYDATS